MREEDRVGVKGRERQRQAERGRHRDALLTDMY